jgi:SAM-dependent methyltransferase
LSAPGEACALCGERRSEPIHTGTDRLFRTTDEVFTIVRCRGCGLARLDPPPLDPGRYYPPGYWYDPSPVEETYRRLVIRDHVNFARRSVAAKSSCRVLDVGCGSGLFLRELHRANPAVKPVGLDASTRAAALAGRLNGVSAVVARLDRAPFAPASFDLITMFHVLEHLPNPGVYVEAAYKLLAPAGKLIVQTPNLDCWQYRLWRSRWSGLDIPRHLYNFRTRDLRWLMQHCGFRVIRVKHFSWRDNPAGLATTIAPALEPVARAARGAEPRNLLYGVIAAAALPFVAMEALFGHGSSIMIEAEVEQ